MIPVHAAVVRNTKNAVADNACQGLIENRYFFKDYNIADVVLGGEEIGNSSSPLF